MARTPAISQSGGGAVVAVTMLSAAFGAVLVMIVADMAAYFEAMGLMDIGQATTMLGTVAALFFGISVFVGAVVTSNSVATVIAGRTREIALLRLIGASGRSLRARTVREGLAQGVVGALAGVVAGVALTALIAQLAVTFDLVEPFAFPIVHVGLVAPFAAVVAATTVASWLGSRKVLSVSPIAATGSSAEPTMDALRSSRVRRFSTIALVVVGFAMLGVGVAVGLSSPLGVLIGMGGGMLSFVGVIIGGPVLLPPLMRLAGRGFGTGSVAKLASANAVRNPARSARAVIGLVIGVTLVTMFAVAASTFRSITLQYGQMEPELYAAFEQIINTTTGILAVLLGFSVLLAAVGMANTLSLSVMQRRRELGLLRALGFTISQVRSMIVVEATTMIASSTLFGLALGIFYGWAGAQATFGSLVKTLVAPSIPWPIIVGVVAVTVVVTIASSLVPARKATRVSPVAALAVD